MKIKGNVIKSRITFVREEFGDEAWRSVLEAMPVEDRKLLETMVIGIKWYDFDLGKRLDSAIIRVIGKGKDSFFEEIGRASAQKNLGSVHRDFLREKDPHEFLEQSPAIYRFYYDTGYRTYERTGKCEGLITTYEAETFSQPDCLTVIGWYKEALQMCGATDVTIIEETCRAEDADACRYRVRWMSGDQ